MSLAKRDRALVWHPFTQELTAPDPLGITRGRGAVLYGEDDREYLDLISSWWVNLHGHCHPHIAQAIARQARTLEHVIFAGVTHEPAVRLAEALARCLPPGLPRFFYSDNGSTSVEVALKMAYQYWRNRNETNRTRFIALDGGYHGDTFGAMAVGNSSGFFGAFADLFFGVDFIPCPHTWQRDGDVEAKEQAALDALARLLNASPARHAAVIMEPLVQGASGMRMFRPNFVRALVDMARSHGLLIIFDEVMTGFGRTGTMFALEQAGVTPDLLCLSKGLTGGFLPLALTVASEDIYQAFLSDDFMRGFIHGHSYTANPLGCAAAIASLEVFETEDVLARIKATQTVHEAELSSLIEGVANLERPRVQGSIAAFSIAGERGYTAGVGQRLKAAFLQAGLLLRPLGNEVYLMPPYCLEPEILREVYGRIACVLNKVCGS